MDLSKSIIQLTFVLICTHIIGTFLLQFVPIFSDHQVFLKIQSLVGLAKAALIYYVFYQYFKFVKNENAQKSSLIIGLLSVIISLIAFLGIGTNPIIMMIISVFFAVSYIFWLVVVIQFKHFSTAYQQINLFIRYIIILGAVSFILKVYLAYGEPTSQIASIITPITVVCLQIPWIYILLFLRKIPEEDGNNHQEEGSENDLLDANI